MKVKNRAIGSVGELVAHGAGKYITEFAVESEGGSTIATYGTIDELQKYWETYKPAEPLIKDEKIRKAVRAWAEADDLDNFRIQNQHFNACKIIGYTAGINKASFIGFQTTISHADSKKLYTLAELCGTPEPLEPTFVDLDERIKAKEEE